MKQRSLALLTLPLLVGQGCPVPTGVEPQASAPATNIPQGVYIGTVVGQSVVDFTADSIAPSTQSVEQAWVKTFTQEGMLAREDGSPVQVNDEHIVNIGATSFREVISDITADTGTLALTLTIELQVDTGGSTGSIVLTGVGQEIYRLHPDGSVAINKTSTLSSSAIAGGLMTAYYQYSGLLRR